jgi:predicted tellurium resistance membrane protein TerC
MAELLSPEGLMSLFTLTFLEIVLGIDNIIFVSIVSNRLPEKDQPKARQIGLILAMVFRLILLLGIGWIISLQKPFYHFNLLGKEAQLTGQAVILAVGGLFLLYKATIEIHHKLEGNPEEDAQDVKKGGNSLISVVTQIALINVIFSIDSILTAVGLTSNVTVMMIAVILSIVIMILFSGPVSKFVNEHPTIQMLGMSFLLLIGFMLISEAAHLCHLTGGSVPKGYLYFSIFFSIFVEMLNIRLRKKQKPVQLHGYGEQAKKQKLLDDDLLD